MDRAVGTHLLRSKPNPAMLYLLALPFAVIGVVASTNGYLNSTYTQLFERALGYVGIAGVCSFQTHRVVMYALVVTNIVLVAVRFLVWSRAYPRLGDPFDMVTVIVDGIMLYAFTFYIFTTGIHDSRDGSRMARCGTANPSGVLCLKGSYHKAALAARPLRLTGADRAGHAPTCWRQHCVSFPSLLCATQHVQWVPVHSEPSRTRRHRY